MLFDERSSQLLKDGTTYNHPKPSTTINNHLEKFNNHLKNIYNHPQTTEYHLKHAINV